MGVQVEGKQISGSPFDIKVMPEPNPSMCRVTNTSSGNPQSLNGSTFYHQVNTPVVLSVDVSKAGTGTLKASGTDPKGKVARVLAAEECDEITNKKLYMLRFDPTTIGTYALDLTWDSKPLHNSPYQVHVIDPRKCRLDVPLPMFLQPDQTATVNVCTAEAGEAELDVVTDGLSVETKVVRKDKENFSVTLKGVQLGKTLVHMKYGGFSHSDQPHGVSVCDPNKCGLADIGKLEVQVGVPFTITVKTENAGKADLQVKPVDSEMQYTFDVHEETPDEWKATCTAWSLGEQELKLLWGEWELPGSPIKFTAVDPKKIKVLDIPDPQSHVAVIGEPINFSVDYSEAGLGSLECFVVHGDLEKESIAKDETEDKPGVARLSVVPKVPGKMELILTYNRADLFSPNLSYEVPDPSTFQVIPPKGYGKLNDSVKFAITGVTADTQLTFKATHPDHEATVEAEKGKDESNIIAHFMAESVGDYEVEVKLKDQHVAGSPFTIKVANPDSCSIVGDVPTIIHSEEHGVFEVDTSSAGPGELGVVTEVISGEIEPAISHIEGGKWKISSTGGVGQCRVTAKWADYVIKDTPFIIQFVESANVLSSCDGVVKGNVKQGDEVTIHLDASRAGQTIPAVKATGPKSNFAVQTTNNNDGTFTLSLNPYQVGENAVTVSWGGKDIPSSPFKFNVTKVIEARTIMASGEGIKTAMTKSPTTVTINAPEAGLLEGTTPSLTASLFPVGAEDETITPDLEDVGGGSYKLTYTPPKEGDYELEILFEKKHVYGSPFLVHAFPSPKAEKCIIFGSDLQKKPHVFKVNTGIQFGVDITDAGKGELTITGKDPSGKKIESIFTNEQDKDGKRVKLVRYTPETVGHHILEIMWEGTDIPNSPLDLNIIDPSQCTVTDLPPQNGLVQSDEIQTIHFSVHCEEAGQATPEVTVRTPAISDEQLQPSSKSASVFNYVYTPTFGNVVITVKYGGFDIPNSPFRFAVADPNRYSISGQNVPGRFAHISEEVSFDVSSQKYSSDDSLEVTMHGPKGEKQQKTVTPQKGKYSHSFTPMFPGSYDIFVECSSVQVGGSPLQINVVDPHKCRVFGEFPSHFQVEAQEEVVLNAQGAGEGDVQVMFNGEKEHRSIECKIVRQDTYTYVLLFKGKQIDSTSVSVLWGGFNIKGSPFHVNISDANKCHVSGPVLTSLKATTGEKLTFSVDTKEAGKSELSVVPKGPSATYKPDIKLAHKKYDISFTPWEVGQLNMDVCWGKTPIPNSPFLINVENSKNVCNATGDGLKTAIVGQKSSFTIITTEMGLLQKKAINVSITGVRTGPLRGAVTDNSNGTYTVTYTPQKPGAYTANITVNKNQVLGCPFKINVVSAPDASKCIAGGPALKPRAVHLTGGHLEVTVDSSNAGTGKLEAVIEGPNEHRPKVYMSEEESGMHSIKFQASVPGRYSVQLLWSGQEIPGSPFKVKVHPAPDASKVRAYGSGLEDGYVNTPGEFLVDTRNGGVGTITLNVHGIKDSFKIVANRSESDSRIISVRYDPTKKGEYVIRVLWDGVHISRSPFIVNIRGKPGSHDSKEDVQEEIKDKLPKDKVPKKEKAAGKTAERDTKVLESSFAKAAPVYDISDTKVGKKSTPKKKEKKGKALTPEPPPLATVGPVAPSLKMRQNVAMAMALQVPQPDTIQDEDTKPGKAKRGVVTKKKFFRRSKEDTEQRGRSVSPKGRPTSPKGKPTSPKGQATSPEGKPTSPKGQATSPKKQPTSPKGKPTSPKEKPLSPKQPTTAPKGQTTAPKQATATKQQATSPKGKTEKQPASPTGQPAAPKKQPSSPTGQPVAAKRRPTSPAGQPVAAKGKAASPTEQPVATKRRPTLPTGQPATAKGQPTSPTGQPVAAKRRATSPNEQPAGQPMVPKGRPTSPTGQPMGQPTSPARQQVSPQRQQISPTGRHPSPQPQAIPVSVAGGHTSHPPPQGYVYVQVPASNGRPASIVRVPQDQIQMLGRERKVPVVREGTDGAARHTRPTGVTKAQGAQAVKPSEPAKPSARPRAKDETDGPVVKKASTTAAARGAKPSPSGGPTSPRAKQQEAPPTKRQTSPPPKSGAVPSSGSRATSPPARQAPTQARKAGKPAEYAAVKQHSTKSPPKQQAAASKPASATKSPSATKPSKQPAQQSGKRSAPGSKAQPSSGSRGAAKPPQQRAVSPSDGKVRRSTSPQKATRATKPPTKKTPQK